MPRDYDSTVARIAGNILSGWGRTTLTGSDDGPAWWSTSMFAGRAVELARAVVDETRRTEPPTSAIRYEIRNGNQLWALLRHVENGDIWRPVSTLPVVDSSE